MSLLQTATSIILHIKQRTDVKNIAIFNHKKNTAVFSGALFIDGSITDDIKFMEHPIENGTTIIDHSIDDAKKATVKFQIDDSDSDTLAEIKEFYQARTPLTLKIKNETVTNMCISSKPVKGDVEHYDTTVYELSFREVQQAETTYVKMKVPQVKVKKNASTVKVGQKQPKPSILRVAINGITGRK